MADTEPIFIAANEGDSLNASGYTDAGISRFKKTVQEYAAELFRKSNAYADIQKESDLPREVTHSHVRLATVDIAGQRPSSKTRWIVCQVFEYVFTAAAGLGAGRIDENWGIYVFGLCTALAVILFVIRQTNK